MRYFLPILVVVFMFSCDTEPAYFKGKKNIPESGWSYGQSLDYSFEIKDTSQYYAIILDMDHSTEYPYQNIYFNITTTYPNGEEKNQVLSADLANKAGVWYGECSGQSCKVKIDLQPKALFQESGKYNINIAQHSRDTFLTGVKQMGLLIQELKQNSIN